MVHSNIEEEIQLNDNKLTDEQALQNFLLDIQCLDELLPWTGRFNIFDVLKVSRMEIRHSNTLGWLFDQNENHGFGDAFLKGVFQKLVENDTSGKYDIFQVLLSDMYSFSVQREWKNIDILITSSDEKIVLAIENKVGSHEHSNQLNRYRTYLEQDYPDYKRFYVFLTPDGEEPSDVENWDVLTYLDVVEILEELVGRFKLQQDVSLLVNNYIEVIRRDIVEDRQLIEICNKIYNKHRKALDLIYANRIDGKTMTSQAIIDTLTKLGDEGKIIHGSDWGNMVFRTSEMDRILPLLPTQSSSWGSKNIYAYWLNFDDGRFYGVFELAGQNVPPEDFATMQKIIDVLKPGDSRRDSFTYKRVFKTKWYDLRDVEDIEEEAEKAVRSVVDELLVMEQKLIAQIQ